MNPSAFPNSTGLSIVPELQKIAPLVTLNVPDPVNVALSRRNELTVVGFEIVVAVAKLTFCVVTPVGKELTYSKLFSARTTPSSTVTAPTSCVEGRPGGLAACAYGKMGASGVLN